MNELQELTEYVDQLYSIAVKKTGDTHVAEDIVQETFLAAIRALARGKHPDNLWRWLVQILSNKYCDWLREKYSKPYIYFEDYPFDIVGENKMDDDDSVEKLEQIRRELGYLGKIHREVMVRFYMYGDSLEKIARELHLSIGTVKSRLNTGRQHIRKGVVDMENFTKQSYDPEMLRISCSGGTGLDDEPFSLVDRTDKLTQNILILAYPKPVTEMKLAKSLGVPVAFIEPIVEKMINGELMQRTNGGKVYTDFIIYTDKNRKATFEKQLHTVEKHFDLFWNTTEKALSQLREKPYYKQQPIQAKPKLELHFCIKLLMNAHIDVRNEITGTVPYSEYPYRKNGGRWFAMGQHYLSDYDCKSDEEFWKYGISGESGTSVKHFRDAKYLALRIYDSKLGSFEVRSLKTQADYVKWFYELFTNVPHEQSSVGDNLLQNAENLINSGILKKDGALRLNIPVLTLAEHQDYGALMSQYEEELRFAIHDVLLPVFNTGYVKLPSHLTSVPKWQQYMFCGDSVPMAVISKAREKGLFLSDISYPLPASILLYEKF